ncbi:single-stranded-DNA-specific exonuclease RecJ [Paenibacillus rhizophilus]|uniref:Single-stranded-DNA-specific exonuclease RecJ n=1 Tax=Paenibacillus rhizophilus TaxID=1850366 RepID=A0A3N9P6C9_9BACL|nr:single-stranded-DNA-specific exonuclease RecJ [Paenibacillus rhizophilus]RQW11748.1 single-stranded-DNA-specific exonuclease RecJ [Paenibacillus rhizophilus]
MLHSKTKWQSPVADPVQSRELARRLSVSPLVASLLVARGMSDPEEALSFIEGAVAEDHDPFLLKGMKEAVPRIKKALEEEEHILVYGDYDADGVSSTSLMIHLLRHLGASFDIYIPHRSNEGYGLHNHALDWALQQGVSLIITVDTGISACSQIAYANELGMDVIVTDHHEPPDVLPPAYALINPKLPGCPYPFKGLAGVGVAYKLAQALLDGQVPEEWLEIAAIGTVADLMPLLDENRAIVRRGLISMRRSKYPGIRALLDVSAVNVEKVGAVNVAFALAPRINASGRLDHAGRAVSLLTTEDPVEAERLAAELDMLNKERQMVVDRIVAEALVRLEERVKDGKLPSIIVLAGEDWNVGVVGIVASKLLERYYRPVIILDIHPETGYCKGSARSIPGLDIYAALSSCADLMDHFGGHPAAAGMSLHRDNLDAFAAALEEFASGVLTEEHFVPVVTADGEYTLADLSLRAAEELELLAPFGMSNPLPKFIVRGAAVKETRTMGQGNRHLKLVLQQEGMTVEAVAFGKGELAELLPSGTGIDVLAELSVNEWNGSRKAQLMLQDLAVPQPQLFDFRGARDAAGRTQRLLDLLLPQTAARQDLAAVVVRKERLREREQPEWQGLSFWVYDQYKGISPLDDLPAGGHSGNPLSLLCLLDMPESPQQLDALLKTFPEVQNIALLHSLRQERDRLLVPTRDHFKTLYKWLAVIAAEPISEQEVLLRLSRKSPMSLRMLKMMLDVFEELDFIMREQGQLSFVTRPAARDLASSSHFMYLSELAEMEQYFTEGSTAELQEWMESRRLGAS